ncbi:hypothetical protein CVT24_011755 [Panaeolus cyanescens]|uniref:Protein YOP1 n=1 Tax=Panaeolus cyanescens TaxID=181874 RepID=A0A409VYP1_9AGAR|nr:hypothetical protein CVT24_011755 [Panaeolus cyanescens]
MPLFVPILRLLMLFLNVYDSYKTLKQPPPSSRNGGKPSVRALTQRKRDMKGCLAVWIVWMCLTMYERVIESIVSLFIPFYDEFKSLVLVFLILTRARGAEPIYLHAIRPFLKPYTSTLDGALEVMLMFGDFLFALTTYPIRIALNWWQAKFGTAETSDAEQDINAQASSPENATDAPTPAQFPQKTQDKVCPNTVRPNLTEFTSIPTNNSLQTSSGPLTNQAGQPVDQPPSQPSIETKSTLQYEEVEEWRRYPAFPAAYPPTPLATNSRDLPTKSPFSTQLETMPEQDLPQQDFRQSLLPPREPLNPSHAGDMSDKHIFSFGIQPPSISFSPSHTSTNFDTEDSLEYNDDEEDDFNITLRTPLNPMGTLKADFPIRRLHSENSAISGISLRSALTTLDLGSLKTSSESESEPPSAIPSYETDSSSVIGKKRAHTHTHSPSTSPRVRQVHAQESISSHRRLARGSSQIAARKPSKPLSATRRRAIILPEDDDSEFVSTTGTEDSGVPEKAPILANQPPEEKRRKVSQPQPREVNVPRRKPVVRSLRQRTVHQTSPTQPRRLRSVVVPDSKRTVTYVPKTHAASASIRKTRHNVQSGPTSATISSDSLPPLPPKDK